MAKAIFVSYKGQAPKNLDEKLKRICKNLEPDNISAYSPFIYTKENMGYGIMNPPNHLTQQNGSFVLGKIFDCCPEWFKPKSEIPDGTFALFRSDENYIELCTDILATRTIWYYFDNEKIIASTSQRAIVMFLGSFSFNSAVIPWMISSGTLGYSNSWDCRINKLEADSTLVLDKLTWAIKINKNKIVFETKKDLIKDYEKDLQEVLDTSFKKLNFIFDNWSLPLSGGYDSRLILLLLKKNYSSITNLRTITWGLSSSREIKGTDGYVAKKLADTIGVKNQYLQTDILENNIGLVLERFLKMGEGRVDHVSGYLDGFELWAEAHNNQIEGVIRGDEGFTRASLGYFPKKEKIRKAYKCFMLNDFNNLKEFIKDGSFFQEFPQDLKKDAGESLSDYRDRFYHQYRVSAVLSSLSDLKLSYLEIANPLISKNIISKIRMMPPSLRTGKRVIKNIVDNLSPDIEYAKYDSIANENRVFQSKEVVELFIQDLNSVEAKELFSLRFLRYIENNISINFGSQINELKGNSLKKRLIKKLPLSIKETLKTFYGKRNLDINLLAFRVFIILRMKNLLNEDSRKF